MTRFLFFIGELPDECMGKYWPCARPANLYTFPGSQLIMIQDITKQEAWFRHITANQKLAYNFDVNCFECSIVRMMAGPEIQSISH